MTAHITPNKITGAKAGGPRPLPLPALWAARIAQFGAHGVKSQYSTNEVGAMTLFRIWAAGELNYATESVAIARLERALKARQKAPQINNQSSAIVEC